MHTQETHPLLGGFLECANQGRKASAVALHNVHIPVDGGIHRLMDKVYTHYCITMSCYVHRPPQKPPAPPPFSLSCGPLDCEAPSTVKLNWFYHWGHTCAPNKKRKPYLVESPPVLANGGVGNGARGEGPPKCPTYKVVSSGVQLPILVQIDHTSMQP
jgi:hypothetical protein